MTLHNQALLNMDSKPTEGFEKLAFLLQQPSFPPVTFGNLLLLYCKHEVSVSLRSSLTSWLSNRPLGLTGLAFGVQFGSPPGLTGCV